MAYLEDTVFENVRHLKDGTVVYSGEITFKRNLCHKCGNDTSVLNGGVTQSFIDSPVGLKRRKRIIEIRRRRYRCKCCMGSFYETLDWSTSGFKVTNRCVEYIMNRTKEISIADCAIEVGLSITTVRSIYTKFKNCVSPYL